jgi:hypothetical protein
MKVCKECRFYIYPEMRIKAGVRKKTGVQKYRAVCKRCHSSRVLHDQKEKLIGKDPNGYWQCVDCCLISHKKFKSDGSCKRCGKYNLKDGNDKPFIKKEIENEKLYMSARAIPPQALC